MPAIFGPEKVVLTSTAFPLPMVVSSHAMTVGKFMLSDLIRLRGLGDPQAEP